MRTWEKLAVLCVLVLAPASLCLAQVPSPKPGNWTIIDQQKPRVWTNKRPGQEHVAFTTNLEGKSIPGSLPTKVSFNISGEDVSGTLYFTSQPAVYIPDLSYRPLGTTESREVKFNFTRQVSFEANGNYLVLPAHAIFSMFGLSLKKKDIDVANTFERLVAKVPPEGFAVYAWSDEKIDFILYERFSQPKPKESSYRGTVTFLEKPQDLRDKINAVIAGYYWASAAKLTPNRTEREQLRAVAIKLLPEEAVDRFLKDH